MPIPQLFEFIEFSVEINGQPDQLLGRIYATQPDLIWPTKEELRKHPYLPAKLRIEQADVIHRGSVAGQYAVYQKVLRI